jgi:hypothetical protein
MIEVQRLTKKLNMDLAVLGVMQKQEFKLKDIEKIYDKFMPKKLIDLDNLNQALELLGRMAGIKISVGGATIAGPGPGPGPGPGGLALAWP